MNVEILSGLSARDESTQLMCLQELNHVLTMNTGDMRVSPVIPLLSRLLLRVEHNMEIILQTLRAINNVIDIDASMCSMLVSEGVLLAVVERIAIIDGDISEQCLKW